VVTISFGYQRQPRIYVGNTAKLTAFIYIDQEFSDEEELVPFTQLQSALFRIQRPQDDPGTYVEIPGDIVDDGEVSVLVPTTINDTAGQYHAIALIVFGPDEDPSVWETRSVIVDYDVADPFEVSGASKVDPAVDQAWDRLSDCFDSEDGGPWLRDMTLARFDKTRVRQFTSDVFFDINGQMPQTTYTADTFDYNKWDGQAVVAQGLLVHSIRHLMRSYVEQPDMLNSPVGYADRKRYLDAWTSMYTIENDRYNRMLELYKRRLFDQGTRSLVSTKSGRAIYGPSRQRGVFRGYY